jgi:hypothetical protein
VLLHPIVVIGLERLQKKFYLQNFLGNPFDTAEPLPKPPPSAGTGS